MPVVTLEECTQTLQDFEERFFLFKKEIENLNDQFVDMLMSKYTKGIAHKHTSNVKLFIIYLESSKDIFELKDLSKDKLNIRFRAWCRSKVWNADSDRVIKTSLKKFFKFVASLKNEHEVEAKRILLLL
ncbi:hypothetical protein [uncultured Vibrio sp.]|uniref:hypothetical protein n=1 Tax=uncultured Vibrio sp. TaxID=114054 RepID=UPI0026020234|nr:hypothetical protein [uncultured Vibrio sp.]